jgi:hypothetical protein
MKPAAIILAVFAAGLAGCRDGGSAQPPGVPSAESFGSLPGLRETPDRELQAELARIVDEGGTPEQLAQNSIPPERNVAAGLQRLFLPRRVAATFEESSEIYPQGRFAFNPVRLQRAIEFHKKYDSQHQHAREALARTECSFGICYQDGFEADLGFVDVVRTCGRLEAFRAAEAIEQDDLLSAIEALGYMLRLAACLAAEKHVTCRSEGAFLRAEALAVLAAIVEHGSLAREHLAALSARLDEQLSRWPPDADAWIGDRALGMHAYEVVRAGRLVELLTPAEIDEFKREGILKDLPVAAQRTVNQDEIYYLRAMREIIDGCSRPFYARTEAFAAIRQDLQEKRNSPEFPIVAARLLLVAIENGQAIQAQDRAACEAWALALALAAGRQRSTSAVNPLTGQPYQVAREQGVVLVWDVLPGDSRKNPTVLVPDLAQSDAKE